MIDGLERNEAGDVLGVTGKVIKNWVEDETVTDYRIGSSIVIPRSLVETYVARAGVALDLEEVSDEEAAALVAESRQA